MTALRSPSVRLALLAGAAALAVILVEGGLSHMIARGTCQAATRRALARPRPTPCGRGCDVLDGVRLCVVAVVVVQQGARPALPYVGDTLS